MIGRDPVAIAYAEVAIRDALTLYALAGCRAGELFVSGFSGDGGPIFDGQELASRFFELIQQVYPGLAGEAIDFPVANLTNPDGQVEIQLVLFEGCPLV